MTLLQRRMWVCDLCGALSEEGAAEGRRPEGWGLVALAMGAERPTANTACARCWGKLHRLFEELRGGRG